jgi:hypothetical protein
MQSLLNTPTEPFPGAGAALYTKYGPRGPANTGCQRKPLSTEPETIQHFVDDCLAHVADLSTRQKTAVRAEVMKMLHDIRFLRMLTDEAKARGPWSQAAVDHSEGTLPPV